MNNPTAADNCLDRVHSESAWRESLMSALAVAFLVLTALALRRFERAAQDVATGPLVDWAFAALWISISLESLIGFWRCGDYSRRSAGRLLLLWLLPPYRLSVSTFPGGRCIWLPAMGWQIADSKCFYRLDRAFSIPMLLMALMVLPILAVEIFWADSVTSYPALALALDLGIATIWLAFAIEFIVMSAVAENKPAYIARHWLNLVIILLPFLAFLRGLQTARLLRLGKLTKALKIYRLRGLSLRAWKGVLTLEILERVLLRSREARLRHLRRRLEEKEQDLERLRERIRELESSE